MTRLLHIADLHFGDESPALVEAFTTYCRDNPPDAIIATGDFTQAGRRREFDVARAFFDTLDAPIVGAPGNHDVPSYALDHRFITPWQRYDRIVGPVVQRSVITDQIHTETLHTARRAQMRPDWSLGRVSNRDLAALIAKFGPGAGRCRWPRQYTAGTRSSHSARAALRSGPDRPFAPDFCPADPRPVSYVLVCRGLNRVFGPNPNRTGRV